MSLKAIVDAVPEGLEDHYVAGTEANDGKFILSVESVNGFGLEDVGGLKRTLDEVKGKASARKASLEAFGEHTPETIAELAIKAQSAGKPNEALESLKTEYTGKLTESQTTIQKLQEQIKQGNHKNAINNIYSSSASSFQDGAGDLVKQIMSEYIGTDEGGNAFVWNDDKTGARMSNKQGAWDKSMSPGEWIEGVKSAVTSNGSFDAIKTAHLKSFGFLLSSNAKTGSGAGTPNAPKAGAVTKESWIKMNLTERTAHVKNGGSVPE